MQILINRYEAYLHRKRKLYNYNFRHFSVGPRARANRAN